MSKYFPLLNQTHVRIELADGKVLNCPMLPVSALADFREITEAFKNADSDEKIVAIRERMVNMAKTVIPSEYHGMLERFPLETLLELLAYLMYGDRDSEPKDDTGKN